MTQLDNAIYLRTDATILPPHDVMLGSRLAYGTYPKNLSMKNLKLNLFGRTKKPKRLGSLQASSRPFRIGIAAPFTRRE